jgi:hypothetical protein
MDYNPLCPAWGSLTWPKVGEFDLANGAEHSPYSANFCNFTSLHHPGLALVLQPVMHAGATLQAIVDFDRCLWGRALLCRVQSTAVGKNRTFIRWSAFQTKLSRREEFPNGKSRPACCSGSDTLNAVASVSGCRPEEFGVTFRYGLGTRVDIP